MENVGLGCGSMGWDGDPWDLGGDPWGWDVDSQGAKGLRWGSIRQVYLVVRGLGCGSMGLGWDLWFSIRPWGSIGLEWGSVGLGHNSTGLCGYNPPRSPHSTEAFWL